MVKETETAPSRQITSTTQFIGADYYQQGWLCPRCGRVNAPWMAQCTCAPTDNRITFNGY